MVHLATGGEVERPVLTGRSDVPVISVVHAELAEDAEKGRAPANSGPNSAFSAFSA